jgi:atypical dual specificity phosphatase
MQRWLAKSIYYPTLSYNYLLGRMLRVRRWWDPVDDHVILGARPMRGDPGRLKLLGVTGVVNTCEELRGPLDEYRVLEIEQLWLPTTDFHHPSELNVQTGAEFIERHRQAGGKVYVHCKAGRARSATIVLWWLVRYQQLSPEQAQQRILQARPHSNREIFRRPVIQQLYTQLRDIDGGDKQRTLEL